MLDIDWNEWERLFPSDMNQGDIMIPPFSFPRYSPSNLQWDPKDPLAQDPLAHWGGELEQK